MAGSEEIRDGLGATLREAVDTLGLPGANAAVLHDGDVIDAAAGVLSLRTNVETTTDSLFQIGSITKVYTATLVMQLVDAGQVDLDAPVRSYVPEFQVKDTDATEAITVRNLLTHTSGFDGGDHFADTGRGDDNIEKYVATLSRLEQITPPGRYWSYNNAGFVVLGRLIENITGQVWDAALRDRLLGPAGLDNSVTLPEDALLFRTASGHRMGDDGKPVTLKQWGMERAAGPAGAICASARDVVEFARMHLADGRASNGNQVLSPASTKAMRQVHVAFPGDEETAGGLAWAIGKTGGLQTVSHNGGTPGQAAFLVTIPERDFAICVLTNGPTGGAVWQQVAAYVFDKALGIEAPKPRVPQLPDEAPDLDLSKYEGTFVRQAVHTTFRVADGGLVAEMAYVDIPYEMKPPPPMAVKPVDAETFVAVVGDQPAMAFRFLEFDDRGRPSLMFASRISRRVE
jgi:CubicO group peptidase (beta-lactamase class C family)